MDFNSQVFEKKPVIKIIQFGEGVFLRAFADFAISKLNNAKQFCGSVCALNLRRTGSVQAISAAGGNFHLILRGVKNGAAHSEIEKIDCISKAVNPYSEFEEFLKLAEIPELRFSISNSTEAGIVFNPEDELGARPPEAFPAKLALLLYMRYAFFRGDISKGLAVLPCELIERNGDVLKECVVKYANHWGLPPEFAVWLDSACAFCSTLVDRIVVGRPSEDERDPAVLSLKDPLAVVAEPYFFWAISAPEFVRRELPLDRCGIGAEYVDDILPYRERKVTLLNAPHTLLAAIGLQMGFSTVFEAVSDRKVSAYLDRLMIGELAETLNFPMSELRVYARSILERFGNPYLRHSLNSIAVGAVGKCAVRAIPKVREFVKRKGSTPRAALFGLAANASMLFANREILSAGDAAKLADSKDLRAFALKLFSSGEIIGDDLSDIPEAASLIADFAERIGKVGMESALGEFLNERPC